MATPSSQNPMRLSATSVALVERYLKMILESHKAYSDLRNKCTAIDLAYFRYKTQKNPDGSATTPGQDSAAADTECGATEQEINVPIVISQTDSFVGYLADVFLSGYPIFPVVSEPKDKSQAEMLESIIDKHATLSQYPRQFLMAFRDGIKYNFMPIETVWEPIDQYKVVTDYLQPAQAAKLEQHSQYYTRVIRRSPYNTVWDYRISPAEVSTRGEFAGYIDLEPRIPLKQFINMYSTSGCLYNVGDVMDSTFDRNMHFYTDEPLVNRYITTERTKRNTFDWMSWMGTGPAALRKDSKALHAGIYEKFTCYCRIIPSELGIKNVPRPNSPQIWKFVLINASKLLYAKPIYTAFDVLPLSIGQPLEDGFGIQTESISEAQIDMQTAASTLFGIRFNAARRAISDRALYDSDLINMSDINSSVPAPKIPVRLSGLNSKTLEGAYKQIPFESRGTETLIADIRNVVDLSEMLSGLNKPAQGRFQKGNKSVQEWNDTMGGADNRLRLPALMTEFQVMIPLKEQIKLNIFQSKTDGIFQNHTSGKIYEVTAVALSKLQETVLSFRIADGFTPKAKLASTEFLQQLIQVIAQSQVLQQLMGPMLPNMIAHLAQLGGVRGLEQYIPQPTGQPAALPALAPAPVPAAAAGAV